MKHIAQATKNRKVNAFVASVRVGIKQARTYGGAVANRGVKVTSAYRSATGDRFEITNGVDVLLIEVDADTQRLRITEVERMAKTRVTVYAPKVVRNYRAFRSVVNAFGVTLA